MEPNNTHQEKSNENSSIHTDFDDGVCPFRSKANPFRGHILVVGLQPDFDHGGYACCGICPLNDIHLIARLGGSEP